MRLMFLIALLFACLAAGAYSILRLTESAPSAHVEAEIGDARFSYQKAYARDAATAVGGLEDRLAFAVAFPSFSPLVPPNASMSSRELAERRQKTILITVTLADDGINPADRPARLYSRFLEGEAVTAQGGLIMRQFEIGLAISTRTAFPRPARRARIFCALPEAIVHGPGAGFVSIHLSGENSRRRTALCIDASRTLGKLDRSDAEFYRLDRDSTAAKGDCSHTVRRSKILQIEIENGDLKRIALLLGIVGGNNAKKILAAIEFHGIRLFSSRLDGELVVLE